MAAQKVTGSVTQEGVVCENEAKARVVAGGEGPKATDLLLMSVAGCSGATLAGILARDGLKADIIDMRVEGVRAEVTPKRFTDIYVYLTVRCEGLVEGKLEHYLKLTERICPVVASLNSVVHFSIELLEA